jgi:hypothetical protein
VLILIVLIPFLVIRLLEQHLAQKNFEFGVVGLVEARFGDLNIFEFQD